MLIAAFYACMVAAGIRGGDGLRAAFYQSRRRYGPGVPLFTRPDRGNRWAWRWAQWITDKVGLETVKYWHPTGWVNQNWLTHVIFC
jgi:hypothetical protein